MNLLINHACRIVSNSEQNALLFFGFLNSQHPDVKFTREKEISKMLAILDVYVNNKDPCNLLMSVYHKKTLLDSLLISTALLCILIKFVLSAP